MRLDGLLRGACHRARIRATRWLAMWVSWLFENCIGKTPSRVPDAVQRVTLRRRAGTHALDPGLAVHHDARASRGAESGARDSTFSETTPARRRLAGRRVADAGR